MPDRRRVRRRRLAVALVVVAAAAGLGGCARGLTRGQIVEGYRAELVARGVPEDLARCVTERFFAGLDDDALRAFQRRDRLTDAETARTAQLADECRAGGGG